MAYTEQEGMYAVGDLGADAKAFLAEYKWWLIGAAALAAVGGYYYYQKKQKATAGYDGLDDTSDCGCDG